MTINHGRMSFQLNGAKFFSPYLLNEDLGGTFRAGVSLSKKGQRVAIADPIASVNLPFLLLHQPITTNQPLDSAETSSTSSLSSSTSTSSSLHLQTVSTNASVSKSGIAAWCTAPGRTTVFSREVFDAAATPVSLRVVIAGGLHDEDICIGFLAKDFDPRSVANQSIGTFEVANSFGFLLRPMGFCSTLRRDRMSDHNFSMKFAGTDDIIIDVSLTNGRFGVQVNGKDFDMPSMINFKMHGMARFGISMAKPGQKVYLAYDGVSSFETAGGGDAAEVEAATLFEPEPIDLRSKFLAELMVHMKQKQLEEQREDDNVDLFAQMMGTVSVAGLFTTLLRRNQTGTGHENGNQDGNDGDDEVGENESKKGDDNEGGDDEGDDDDDENGGGGGGNGDDDDDDDDDDGDDESDSDGDDSMTSDDSSDSDETKKIKESEELMKVTTDSNMITEKFKELIEVLKAKRMEKRKKSENMKMRIKIEIKIREKIKE
jgi:hypothetical protein